MKPPVCFSIFKIKFIEMKRVRVFIIFVIILLQFFILKFIINAEENVVQLTFTDGASNIDPVWSPDGKKIAFVSNINGDFWNIYLINPDGSGFKKLTYNAKRNFSPAWSPDSKKLVFVSSRARHEDLYVIDVNTKKITRITYKFNLRNATPAWMPDGRSIVFVSFKAGKGFGLADIYTVSSDGDPTGENTLQLTNTGDNYSPAPSPDGKQLAFVSSRTGFEEIFLLDLNTKEEKQITEFKTEIGFPRWSPDGRRLVFMIKMDKKFSSLGMLKFPERKFIRLTEGNFFDYVPCWSPDGRKLVFVSDRDGNNEIYILNLNETGL